MFNFNARLYSGNNKVKFRSHCERSTLTRDFDQLETFFSKSKFWIIIKIIDTIAGEIIIV